MIVSKIRYEAIKGLLEVLSTDKLSKQTTVVGLHDIEAIDASDSYEEYLQSVNSSEDLQAVIDSITEVHDKLNLLIDILLKDNEEDLEIIW